MKKILCLSLLISSSLSAVTPYFSIRSQSANAARELVGAGWNTHINECDTDCFNANISITPEYTRSFDSKYIGYSLFDYCGNRCCTPDSYECITPCCCPYAPLEGPCCTPGDVCCSPCITNCCDDNLTVIQIAGIQALNRMQWDWVADYFGLPTDYKSCLVFEPSIDNFLIDFNVYAGLDNFIEGLYINIYAPIVHTRWALNMGEIIKNYGSNPYWPGYFNKTFSVEETSTIGIPRDKLTSTFSSYIAGCQTITDNSITFEPLKYAKITKNQLEKTGFSDVIMAIGCNFLCNQDYHLGINLRAAAPAGNAPKALCLFEPIIGNGKHWQAGMGLSAHVVLNRNECNDKIWQLYADAKITHLFNARQCRTFDLCCKPLSRYMLAANLTTQVNDLQAADDDGTGKPKDPIAPSHQFTGIYTPVANLTTLNVDSNINIQAELALMLQHIHCNWSFDLGYNFWGTSCENISVCNCNSFSDNTWALKGDAFMYGFKQNPDTSISTNPIALSASQSGATLYNGKNSWPHGNGDYKWVQNPGVNNKKLAWDDSDNPILILDVNTNTSHQILTSLNPKLIKFTDIDIYGARTQGVTHKIFGNIDYTWSNLYSFVPYLGIGGEIEFGYYNDELYPFGSSSSPCVLCESCCDSCVCDVCMPCGDPSTSNCQYCSLSQWGIWLKGGVAF